MRSALILLVVVLAALVAAPVARPAALVDTSRPDRVVGNGSAASWTASTSSWCSPSSSARASGIGDADLRAASRLMAT